MDYEWRRAGPDRLAPISLAWFDDQDRRFIEASRHFATHSVPFDRLIPYGQLKGKRLLEIGVGSGLHAELMARAGAEITGIDLTQSAIERTRRRFELKDLTGSFEQADAEQPHADFIGQFDYVWSWGVIHHSSRTALIVRNVQQWLTPQGGFAGMVYHRDSTSALIALVNDWCLKGNLRSHSVDEALWRVTDGYRARFYPAEQWRDLLYAFFRDAEVSVTGSITDMVPLPRLLRNLVAPRIGAKARDRWLARFGGFVTFRAAEPLDT
jgi:SAM-dependent methyltransferase